MINTVIEPSVNPVKIAAGAATPVSGPQIVVSHEPADREWDEFLMSTPGGHHVQSSLWAQLKETLGWSVVRLVVRESGQIVGGAQILMRRIGSRFQIGYMPKGPIFTPHHEDAHAVFMSTLQQEVFAHNLHCLIVQPMSETSMAGELQQNSYRPVRLATFLQATTIIDLQPSLDDIFMAMSSMTRRKVRQGSRRGLTVRQGGAEDLTSYYDLLMATARRQGFHDYPRGYFEKLWSLFAPDGHAQLFLAESNEKPIAALMNISFGDTVVNKKRGWSGELNELRPNDAMDWASIQWAKEAGYRYYDLEGIPLSAAEAVLRGEQLPEEAQNSAACYKIRFGGQVQILPATLAYFSNPLVRWGHRVVYPRIANWPIVDRLADRIKVN